MHLKHLGILVIVVVVLGGAYYWKLHSQASTIGKTGLSGATINKTNTTRTDFTNGLVGHWTFDGPDMLQNVADVSGQGNHGALQGQTSTTTAPGRIGQALEFDGVDDYVVISDNSSLHLTNMTLSAWVYDDGTDTSNNKMIFDGAQSWNADGYVLYRDGSRFISLNIDGTEVDSTNQLPQNQWVLVTATYDGSVFKIYLDGTVDNSAVQTATIDNQVTDRRIGGQVKSFSQSSRYWSGQLDDVRIYNRALSADEVKALYDGTKGSHINVTRTDRLTDGLVGHWTFDGPHMLQNVADVSGQGNHGNLQGQTSTTTAIGKIGQGLEFDATDDVIVINDSAALDAQFDDDFSICVWFKPLSFPIAGDYGLVEKLDNADIWWRFYYGDLLFFETDDGTTKITTTSATDFDTDFASSQWHHACATREQGANQIVYINGASDSSDATQANTLQDDDDTLRIGGNAFNSHWSNSALDDVRIYNRALSADEVKELYNMGRN